MALDKFMPDGNRLLDGLQCGLPAAQLGQAEREVVEGGGEVEGAAGFEARLLRRLGERNDCPERHRQKEADEAYHSRGDVAVGVHQRPDDKNSQAEEGGDPSQEMEDIQIADELRWTLTRRLDGT
jgi:hypothetical protein